MRWITRQLLRARALRRAVIDQITPEPFRPDRRFRWGVALLALGLLTGWPLVAALGGLALWSGRAWIILVGGPVAYAISWLIYGAGLLLAGLAARRILASWYLWALRRLVERLSGSADAARALALELDQRAQTPETLG